MIAAILLAQTKAPLLEAQKLTDACAKAFREKDKSWFERTLAAGFVYRDLEGETKDRAGALERIEGWFHPLGYRVTLSMSLASSAKTKDGLRIVGDLKARSQLMGWKRMPLTETTVRVASTWRLQNKAWLVYRIDELGSKKVVDGREVERRGVKI